MKNFFRQNGLLLVLIALLLSVLIGVGSALLGGNTDPLSNVVNTVASPIRGGVSAVMDWAEGVYTYVFHYQELHDQLSDLQVKVSQLEEQVRQGEQPGVHPVAHLVQHHQAAIGVGGGLSGLGEQLLGPPGLLPPLFFRHGKEKFQLLRHGEQRHLGQPGQGQTLAAVRPL